MKAGDGGSGCISFFRSKYQREGPANGGSGGKGGNVIIQATSSNTNLSTLPYFFKAGNGGRGEKEKKHGKNGNDFIVKVPLGTIIKNWDPETRLPKEILKDLEKYGESYVVAEGGKGGRGNFAFSSSTNRSPKRKELGEIGEEKNIFLELKMIADIGLVVFLLLIVEFC